MGQCFSEFMQCKNILELPKWNLRARKPSKLENTVESMTSKNQHLSSTHRSYSENDTRHYLTGQQNAEGIECEVDLGGAAHTRVATLRFRCSRTHTHLGAATTLRRVLPRNGRSSVTPICKTRTNCGDCSEPVTSSRRGGILWCLFGKQRATASRFSYSGTYETSCGASQQFGLTR